MIVLMVSKWVGDLFNISLYDLHVELKCMPFVEAKPSGNMYHLRACDMMAHPVVSLRERMPVRDIVETLKSCAHNGFPIVTASADDSPGKFTGTIVRNQIIVLLNKRAWGSPTDAMHAVTFDDFSTSLSSKVSATRLPTRSNRPLVRAA
jgi:chloride channel 7